MQPWPYLVLSFCWLPSVLSIHDAMDMSCIMHDISAAGMQRQLRSARAPCPGAEETSGGIGG